MQKIIAKIRNYDHFQRLIICVCISIVCIGSQKIQTSAWNSGSVEFFRDLTGILMALIIMTNFRRENIAEHKKVYIGWTVIAAIGSCIWIPCGIRYRSEYLKSDTVILAIAFWLMGYCLIYTFINILKNRKTVLSLFFKPLTIIWVIMFILMMISRSTYLWPFAYFALFMPFYLTEQTDLQRRESLIGLSNGLILGFMLVQAHSMLTRPFDTPFYYGNFSNPNHNCMFLCMCLAGILGRILVSIINKEKIPFILFLIMLLGADLSYIFMTGCKSGFVSTFLLVLFFIIFSCVITKKKIFIRLSLALAVLFVVSLPVTYLAVRYLPTIHPHINFYANDAYSLNRVHYYDPYDSPKFTSFESIKHGSLWKVELLIDAIENHLTGEASTYESNNNETVNQTDSSSSTDEKTPALTLEQGTDPILVRTTIYKWYFDHLTLRGLRYDEQGFQLAEKHWIQDTHNIYLDYGINFGWPVMLLFAIMIWWGIGCVFRKSIKSGDTYSMISFLVLLVPPTFGLFEYSWGPGMISTIAFYFCMKEFLVKKVQ